MKENNKPKPKKFSELSITEKQIFFTNWLIQTGLGLILEAFCTKVYIEHEQGAKDFNYSFVSKLGVKLDIKFERQLIQT